MPRSKPLPPNPKLERLLKDAADRFKEMTPERQETELQQQRQSWARQDMD
jgi:hypothetical protein